MRVLAGSKDGNDGDEHLPQAVNILTCIGKVDREIEGFRKFYDILSEYAHPNWSGSAGMFTETDYENILIDLGLSPRKQERAKFKIGTAFATNMELFVIIYNEFAEFLPNLTQLCERQIEKRNRDGVNS
jgi:hypothetical protein